MVNFHLQTVKRQGVLPMTRDYIAAETAKWAKVIKDAGIKPGK